ncbi:MAG: AMP-binding protein [Candidatus Levybacteria bacterium]|nr:AMP-binding protein [Candidatus Levybacteria bacterium]
MKTLVDLFSLFKGRGKGEIFIYRTGIRRFPFSYKRIYDLSLKMASFLEERGIGKGDRVCLWAGNSPWWAVAFFGILIREAIVVPIDFISGKTRAQTIIKLSGAKLIIQSEFKLEKLLNLDSIIIENLQYILKNIKPLSAIPKPNPKDIAELVYTSGTTGDPKGVILTHKNIVSNVIQATNHIVIPSRFTFLSLLPMSHMFEQTVGFLAPLFRGDKVVFLRTLRPQAIMDALKEENISAVGVVPRLLDLLKNTIEREIESKKLATVWKILIKLSKNKSIKFKKFIFYPIHKKFGRNFEMFISGGASLSLNTAKFWKDLGFKVVEGYGLTECSPILSANTLKKQVLGSVGKAVKGVRIKIKDGEILTKGENVFSGYWQNQKETAKAFDSKGWFKTGDTGWIDKNNNVYIKGRKKDVIVTSEGINVYPQDIEAILNYVPGVKEACVVGLNRGRGEEAHAVLTLKAGFKNMKQIIQKANEKLDPQNQITSFSVWRHLDFPKTTTLKIQKYKVLEELKSVKEDHASTDILISLISNLTLKPIDEIKEDSLLTSDLGFTSISRLELVNYIEQEFRIDLDDSIINQSTKVKDLRKIILEGIKNITPNRLKFYPNTKYGIKTRAMLDRIFHFPFIRYFFDLKVKGLENLKTLKGPVIFISNHLSYLDQPAIMFSLPKKWRYSTGTAMREEFFFAKKLTLFQRIWKELAFAYATIAFNSFLLPQYSGFRKSLTFMGKLIDNKVSILVFPEGSRARDGQLQDFMAGLGLMVKELQIPVVPIRISGIENIFPRGAILPKKGKCVVTFGKPIEFTTEPPSEIIKKSRDAILKLAV